MIDFDQEQIGFDQERGQFRSETSLIRIWNIADFDLQYDWF